LFGIRQGALLRCNSNSAWLLTELKTCHQPIAITHPPIPKKTTDRPPTKHRLVTASPSASRAIASGSINPLMGCSPIEVAAPVKPVWACAKTATSETGSCRGPQHCCCATRPWGWGLGVGFGGMGDEDDKRMVREKRRVKAPRRREGKQRKGRGTKRPQNRSWCFEKCLSAPVCA